MSMVLYKEIKRFQFILFLFVMVSCSHKALYQSRLDIVWPGPPETPKIKYVDEFSSPRQLGITARWYQKIHRFITGKKEKKVRIISPYSVYIDNIGDIYITDTFTSSLHIFSRRKKFYKEISSFSGVKLQSPIGVAMDNKDRLFITDSILNCVFVLNSQGKYLFAINSNHFKRPTGIAIDQDLGKIYVVDTLDHKIKVFNIDGKPIAAFGENGTKPGEFNFPTFICVNNLHHVIVGDTMNFRIQIFDQNGHYLNSFGQAGDGTGYFSKMKGVAVDSMGHIYVCDAQFDVVQIFDGEGNFLLHFGGPGRLPGEFQFPAGICIDKKDMIYIVDKLNQRVQIFKFLQTKNDN